MEKVKIVNQGMGGCGVWFIGWIFTIGFLQLSFWEGFKALILWPYFIGVFARTFLP